MRILRSMRMEMCISMGIGEILGVIGLLGIIVLMGVFIVVFIRKLHKEEM